MLESFAWRVYLTGCTTKRDPISCQKLTELQRSCLRKGRRNTHTVKRNHKSGDPPSVYAGTRLCVHDIRTKQVLDARRHGGTLVQKALSSVPVNQTSPLHRRERRGDSPSVVTLLGHTKRIRNYSKKRWLVFCRRGKRIERACYIATTARYSSTFVPRGRHEERLLTARAQAGLGAYLDRMSHKHLWGIQLAMCGHYILLIVHSWGSTV